ncbi:MAG: 30S ribosomal protein S20 [Cyanobacteria bacterium P01_A01_bin.123]
MANIKSAIKRVQVAERNRLRNKSYKSAVKTLTKRYFEAVDAHAVTPSVETEQAAQARLSAAYSKIDKAIKAGALHPNAGARRKARLARALKQKTQAAAS